MHLVTAIIKLHVLDAVKDSLRAAGVSGLTLSEASGFGRQGGHTETYRGAEYQVDFVPKLKLEILTEEPDKVADIVAGAAATGAIGDGKIWITEVARAIRIRTGEEGSSAL